MPALESGYFNLDEYKFEELLSMGADIASVVNFYDLKNEISGTWAEIFNSDEAVIMASILTIDVRRIESNYINSLSFNQNKILSIIIELATKFNVWLNQLNACQQKYGNVLALKISRMIREKLANGLHNAGDIVIYDKSYTDEYGEIDFSLFGSVWGISRVGDGFEFTLSSVDENQDAQEINKLLISSLHCYLNSISYLKTVIPEYLNESLKSQYHHPAIGLFIVFLKLYEKSKDKANKFTQRHLDFYYQQVLRVKERDKYPESVYLQFEAQAGAKKAIIKKNAEFSPGKDMFLNDIIYKAEENLLVTDTKVESLATLYLQQDKLISPESELGYVTRIKSCRPEMEKSESEEGLLTSWPLFGTENHGDKKVNVTEASLGFYIASPLLFLKEGVRQIEINMELQSVNKSSIDSLRGEIERCETKLEFTDCFGRLYAHYLLSSASCLSEEGKRNIIEVADKLLPGNMSNEVVELLTQDWQGIFYKLIKKIFRIKLTTEEGWYEIKDSIIHPLSDVSENNKMGLSLNLNLGQEIVPITPYNEIVHGENLLTEYPVLQCDINPQSNFYPYSIFKNLLIETLQINIAVSGVKNILAYNHHGQLDPTKPFQPFGPLPTMNSYLVVGNYELSRKPLTDLEFNIEWGDIPTNTGGFEEIYRGYNTKINNNTFKGSFTALADSRWVPARNSVREYIKLFDSDEKGWGVCSSKSIKVNVLEYNKPVDSGITEELYQYNVKSRGGFFKLSLNEPATAFGHAEYAQLLTKTLSANSRLKKPQALPKLPYTPVVNSISIDYKASSTLKTTVNKKHDTGMIELIHKHPFGVETIIPDVHDKPCYFLPQYSSQGSLFIGLSGTNISGILNLFFHMSEDLERVSSLDNADINWYYLSENTWKKLSARRIHSDTTNGFLSSGKISINIPENISVDNTVMPGGLYWLRVSTAGDAHDFSGFFSISTHAIRVTRENNIDINTQVSGPEKRKWKSIISIPGISKINQAGEIFGGRSLESDSELKIRLSERLRHKNRALVPWDYEHLILEEFPELYKVKCFSATSDASDSLKPGHVLIVVVEKSQSLSGDICKRSMINSDRLRRIKNYIKAQASPFIKIKVRNPVYEKVQVRCTVKFVDSFSSGFSIERLNQDISDYICPWKKGGYSARFGWSIRQKDIESYIRNLNYVEYLTNVSMLHITVDSDGKYNLFDTAKDSNQNDIVITPRFLWSLVMPLNKHFIETIPKAKTIKEEVTGVNELEIGGTFIISGSCGYGEEE